VREEQCRAAGPRDTVGDLGDLEVGSDLRGDLVQLALAAQVVEPVAEILEGHSGRVYVGGVEARAVAADGWVMLATPVTGYLMWFVFAGVGIAAYIARTRRWRAEEESIESWAAGKGYQPGARGFAAPPLRQATNGHVGPCFTVPIGDGDGALFAFTYTIGSGRDQRAVDTTLVQANLAPGLPQFRVVPRHANDLPSGP